MTDIVIERDGDRETAARAGGRDEGPDAARAQGVHTTHAIGRESVGPDGRRNGGMDPLFGVRTADIEPYTGLRYLSKLFRMIAVVLLLLLVAEVATGLYTQGWESLTTLLSEVSKLIVLAGLLWGAGDLAILLIDVGHDVRAARILLGRQTSHHMHPTPTEAGHARAADRVMAAPMERGVASVTEATSRVEPRPL